MALLGGCLGHRATKSSWYVKTHQVSVVPEDSSFCPTPPRCDPQSRARCSTSSHGEVQNNSECSFFTTNTHEARWRPAPQPFYTSAYNRSNTTRTQSSLNANHIRSITHSWSACVHYRQLNEAANWSVESRRSIPYQFAGL